MTDAERDRELLFYVQNNRVESASEAQQQEETYPPVDGEWLLLLPTEVAPLGNPPVCASFLP